MEFLDVVDNNDNVVGRTAYEEVYAKKLGHRIVHVLIFNDKGEMALQLRSMKKLFCPGHWSTAVGGHVQAGENYEQAALREFEEELGRKTEIKFENKFLYETKEGMKKHLGIFSTVFNGPFEVNLEEVDKVEYFKLDKIKEMINQGEKFHPELLFLLKKSYF